MHRLHNEHVRLALSTAFGPRILHFGPRVGPNLLWVDQDTPQDDGEWHVYGGHRLWRAPEDPDTTYEPDNAEVLVRGDERTAVVRQQPDRYGLGKVMEVRLDGPGVRLVHALENHGLGPVEIAAWAITCMAPGGVAEVPQPPARAHPDALLPDRRVTLWPYTDPADPRIGWARERVTIRQGGPDSLKVGFGNPLAELSYVVDGWRFTKRGAWDARAPYPDLGSNLEVYTNAQMLELETLSPLVTLQPGQAITLWEQWSLERERTDPAPGR